MIPLSFPLFSSLFFEETGVVCTYWMFSWLLWFPHYLFLFMLSYAVMLQWWQIGQGKHLCISTLDRNTPKYNMFYGFTTSMHWLKLFTWLICGYTLLVLLITPWQYRWMRNMSFAVCSAYLYFSFLIMFAWTAPPRLQQPCKVYAHG